MDCKQLIEDLKKCRVTLSSCGVVFSTTYETKLKKITKRERKQMIFNDLREDYSKVLYPSNPKVSICPPQSKTHNGKSFNAIGGVCTSLVLTSAIYFNLDTVAHASNFTAKAEGFYFGTFMSLAKWVIIVKGGWDVIAKTLKEDFEGAKKSVVQYMVVFAVLMGLPHALNFVEDFFQEGI